MIWAGLSQGLARVGFRCNGLKAWGLESPESSLAHMFAGGCWLVGAVSQSTTCGLSPWPWLPHNMVARVQVWEPQKREPSGSRVLFVTQPWKSHSNNSTLLVGQRAVTRFGPDVRGGNIDPTSQGRSVKTHCQKSTSYGGIAAVLLKNTVCHVPAVALPFPSLLSLHPTPGPHPEPSKTLLPPYLISCYSKRRSKTQFLTVIDSQL